MSNPTPEPGKPCPACHQLVPMPEEPPRPFMWARVELPDHAPQVQPAKPFMTGSNPRKGRDAA